MKAAIEIIEKLRTNVASQQLRTSYFATVQGYYKFYIDLLMQLHKTNSSKGYDALALNASERARARNLLEILTEARANIRRGVDPKLREQERTLQQQINAKEFRKYQLLNNQRGKKETEELNAIPKEIESLLNQLDEVQAQIRQKYPTYADITQPGKFTLTLPEIQQQVLDDNTLLLEYSLGEDRSYLWAVTKTSISSYELPKRTDIEAAAEEFKTLLQSENSQVIGSQAAQKLSQMLLAPVANQLGHKRLLIVSDGALQYIPFAALPIPEGSQASNFPASRLGINSEANSSSRLKTTETTINSPLERTFAISQGFKPLADANSYIPLLVQHEIVSLPSASTLAVLRRDTKNRPLAPKTLAVLADPVFDRKDDRLKITLQSRKNPTPPTPDFTRSPLEASETYVRLPGTLTEAEQILQLVPNTTQRFQAFGFTASRTTATNPDLSQYRLIHFATHGRVDNAHPELSKVVLSLVDENGADTNGFLHLQDIFNLNLPAELVVLSACQTGVGKDVQGEGLIGLTRGFMYAGSKRVVVSLWRVKDRATADLMTKFYQQMLEKGLNPVAALRAAQLEMWKTEQWKSPYYCAAFIVQGEWK